jgi:hypothetical protein
MATFSTLFVRKVPRNKFGGEEELNIFRTLVVAIYRFDTKRIISAKSQSGKIRLKRMNTFLFRNILK